MFCFLIVSLPSRLATINHINRILRYHYKKEKMYTCLESIVLLKVVLGSLSHLPFTHATFSSSKRKHHNYLASLLPPLSHPFTFPTHPTMEKAEGEEDMTQLCSSDTHLLLGLLFYDLLSLFSFLASHPLHLAYFLFFFPYLFQLLSFFSPLLLSTSLLLLVLLTISPQLDVPPLAPPGLLGNTCSILFNLFKANLEGHDSVELLDQLASMVLAPIDHASPYFQEPVMPALVGEEVFELEFGTMGDFCNHSSVNCVVEESPSKPGLQNSQKSELLPSKYGIRESPLLDALEDPKERELLNSCRMPEPAADSVGGELVRSTSRRRKQSTYRGSDGLQRENSMRKEKEWKRTLACKLYEERMTYKLCEERTVVEGGEEMDLLWEAYEVNASKGDKLMSNGKKGKKDEQEEEEEEDEGKVGQLCCLQALRVSAGKMNLGVGRPNLVKISKVLKGMAMFQSVGRHSSRKG